MISFLGMTTLTLAILIVIGVIALAIIGVLFWTKIVEHKERRAFLRLRKKKKDEISFMAIFFPPRLFPRLFFSACFPG